MDGWVDRGRRKEGGRKKWMNGSSEGEMDGWMDGPIDQRMDRAMRFDICRHIEEMKCYSIETCIYNMLELKMSNESKAITFETALEVR